jgi:predicted ATP-dependent endonuclease of OLD family
VFGSNTYTQCYELTYQEDNFHQMSQGKQAFVILKLLLEFSEKTCPILIDQPEDSLDNRAIYNELVKYLKDKKRDRQIILVTHNSNVVVSADAEQIIVANQNGITLPNSDGTKFQYVTGSIEHSKTKKTSEKTVLLSQGIREHICEILEGGNEAFKKREQKYQLSETI